MSVNGTSSSSILCVTPPTPSVANPPTEEKVTVLAKGWFDLNKPPQHNCSKLGCTEPTKPKCVVVCPPLGMSKQCFKGWKEIAEQIKSNQS